MFATISTKIQTCYLPGSQPMVSSEGICSLPPIRTSQKQKKSCSRHWYIYIHALLKAFLTERTTLPPTTSALLGFRFIQLQVSISNEIKPCSLLFFNEYMHNYNNNYIGGARGGGELGGHVTWGGGTDTGNVV